MDGCRFKPELRVANLWNIKLRVLSFRICVGLVNTESKLPQVTLVQKDLQSTSIVPFLPILDGRFNDSILKTHIKRKKVVTNSRVNECILIGEKEKEKFGPECYTHSNIYVYIYEYMYRIYMYVCMYYNPRMKQFFFIYFHVKLSVVLRCEAAVLPEGYSISSGACPCTTQEYDK